MKEDISMTIKEISRSEVLSDLKQRLITQEKAAEILNISTRQVRRLFKNYKIEGPIKWH